MRQVAGKLSADLQTTVEIRHVNFDLFNTMRLEGTLVKDRAQDTLLYAGNVRVNITDWFFFMENIELKYVGLEDAVFHLNRSDSIWNYGFLIDYFGSGPAQKKKNTINLNLREIDFKHVAIIQKDAWRGENLSAMVTALHVDAENFDLNEKSILINSIDLDGPSFSIYNYPGKRPPLPEQDEEVFVNDPENLRWNAGKWSVLISELNISNGSFRSDLQTEREPFEYFDGNHIFFSAIDASFKSIRLQEDSIRADVRLSARERSGLLVRELTSDMLMHPEAMEFSNLDLRTNRSHLKDFFAMRYNTFDDMQQFISRVRMEANFDAAQISSDDIAFFAPEVASWNTTLRLSGRGRGTVENLNGRDMVLQAGRNTYLQGDFSIAGLPYIDKTYIDFEAADIRTTYADATAFFPALRNLKQPRLDLLNIIRFRGNFTGFPRDFVTFGTLQTQLGTLVTDLNMKIPSRGTARYSGSLKSTGFDLGTFVQLKNVGRLSFEGKIDGRGLSGNALDAELDGRIALLEYNEYPYRDIAIKGKIAKRLFNGELISYDPNLDAQLNGLIDFGQDIPVFDFDASLSKVNLQKLNLFDENLEFNGKFSMNFSGNTVDNFLGTMRVYDASVFRNEKRISFDSLFVESKIADDQKIITAVSNEFDAALVGEFSIVNLPDAFRNFLHRYYPAYIKPANESPGNENFSFVISTKNVDEYANLINNDLSGFNNSTITGRINGRENLLDLNADIPSFQYKQIIATGLGINAHGSYDSLSLDGNIANVYINDSLHFPGTSFRVSSSSDLSDISIRTSSNQSLNTANLEARVQTIKDGVKITFRESEFELNGKHWTVEDRGELTLSQELILADGIRIFNDQQEILVTTLPSDIGNSNDIHIDLRKVNIGDFTPYLITSNRIEGVMTGKIKVIDPFRKPAVEMEALTEHFRLDNDSIGSLNLAAMYDHRKGVVDFRGQSDNYQYQFDLNGQYRLKDSLGTDNLNILARVEHTRINLLEQYLSGVFSDLTGLATGTLRITGATNDLDFIGRVQLSNGGLRVNYTNVYYTIPTALFDFRDDQIDFGNFLIRDTLGNTGRISRGKLYHNGFNDLSFDFAMNTSKLLVLSTGNNGVDPFYGNVIARADMSFSGPLEAMVMDIRGEPADSSKLYITTQSSRESGQADFVVWKVYGREMDVLPGSGQSNLTVYLDVTANNYADMYVILDELTGDIIRANGRGNLQIRAGTDGEFTIVGKYDIDRGNYNFSFESLLKKPFRLKEGVGNYIQWNGDPNNARIKIDAEYEAENVRFSDLGLGDKPIQNQNLLRYRGKVLVLAKLTEDLNKPTIDFEIGLPPGSPFQNDVDAANIFREIQADPNELNKQVAFLIVFNSFGPLSSSSTQGNFAGVAFEGLVINSISGVLSNSLSNQFSNIFQKIFNDKSIRVNFNAQLYSGTNFINNINRSPFSIDRTNLNLSIGKSIFNERLTFTFGSALDFGLSSAQMNAARNLPFLPDITAEWKIRPDGKVVLLFFYRDTYNYLMEGARQNRTGASISFRREFDRIRDIWTTRSARGE